VERDYLARCVREDFVGYRWVERFEETLAEECGVKHAVAMSSGTAALEAAVRCVYNNPARNRILMPSLTFQATAAAVRHVSNCWPQFIDADFVLSPADIERAIDENDWRGELDAAVVVDLLGLRPDMVALERTCAAHNAPLIEDAAQAIGEIHGVCGECAIVRFNSNKTITTGGGGALLTNHDDLADEARRLSTTAGGAGPPRLSWNYRMSNAAAAVGCAQLERLDEIKAVKRRLAERYIEAFQGVANFIVYPWLNAIMVPREDQGLILDALAMDGIEARKVVSHPLHLTEAYGNGDELPRCEDTWGRMICLPSGPRLA